MSSSISSNAPPFLPCGFAPPSAGGSPSTRLIIRMGTRVPAINGDVDTAAKGDIIIDHDHLLVMRSRRWMMAVQPQVNLRILDPQGGPHQRFCLKQRLERAGIPPQDMHL